LRRDRPRLVFYHLPRTAGRSLIGDILYRNFPRWRRCIVNYDSNMSPSQRQDPRAWPAWRLKATRLLVGHMPFGFAECFPGPSEVFTFLRDPIQRAVSDYYYCCHDPNNPAYPAASKMSLTEFVETDRSFVRNGYARWLSNEAYGMKFATDEAMLEEAMKNLAKISFVGITEQFDASVGRLCERYGLTAYSPTAVRRNNFTPEGRRLSDREQEILEQHNRRSAMAVPA